MGSVKSVDPTPNPNSMKITVDRSLTEERKSESYFDAQEAEKSPLAKACFSVQGITSVFILNDFVTVGREPTVAWEEIMPKLTEVLEEHLKG